MILLVFTVHSTRTTRHHRPHSLHLVYGDRSKQCGITYIVHRIIGDVFLIVDAHLGSERIAVAGIQPIEFAGVVTVIGVQAAGGVSGRIQAVERTDVTERFQFTFKAWEEYG